MEKNKFNLCPHCGSRNIETLNDGLKWFCHNCGFDLYNNVASAVGLLIKDSQNRFLLEKRAKEPRKGYFALPGGFTDADESAEEAAERECIEETGVKPEHIVYICSAPNTYLYKNIEYKTCDLFFTATLPDTAELKAQKGEVDGFEWVAIQNKDDIEKCPLAFPSAKKALYAWLEQNNK